MFKMRTGDIIMAAVAALGTFVTSCYTARTTRNDIERFCRTQIGPENIIEVPDEEEEEKSEEA